MADAPVFRRFTEEELCSIADRAVCGTDVILRAWEIILGHHPKDHPGQIRVSNYRVPRDQVEELFEQVRPRMDGSQYAQFVLDWMNCGPSAAPETPSESHNATS